MNDMAGHMDILSRDVERTRILEKELDMYRLKYEKDMSENREIIDRLRRSLDDAARYRPAIDDRHYYDKQTVDQLAKVDH